MTQTIGLSKVENDVNVTVEWVVCDSPHKMATILAEGYDNRHCCLLTICAIVLPLSYLLCITSTIAVHHCVWTVGFVMLSPRDNKQPLSFVMLPQQ